MLWNDKAPLDELAALDRLCELDGPEKARRHARADSNLEVRKWRPRGQETSHTPALLDA